MKTFLLAKRSQAAWSRLGALEREEAVCVAQTWGLGSEKKEQRHPNLILLLSFRAPDGTGSAKDPQREEVLRNVFLQQDVNRSKDNSKVLNLNTYLSS
jgi:hypothetical protein